MTIRLRTVLLLLPLIALFRPAACLVQGQTLTYAGPQPSLNFGSVNICAAGSSTSSPCTETLSLSYNVTAGGTLGTPKVLTLGAPNLDFTLAAGGTCTGTVTTGTTCTVKVTFAPEFVRFADRSCGTHRQ
jgi:hypothetical protein